MSLIDCHSERTQDKQQKLAALNASRCYEEGVDIIIKSVSDLVDRKIKKHKSDLNKGTVVSDACMLGAYTDATCSDR